MEDPMERHDEHDSRLVPNDPAYTASREEADRVRAGGAPAPREGGLEPGTAATIGTTAGGAAMGAGMGTILGGPIGAIIGAIAGAIGGWWAGRGVTIAAREITPELEEHYRAKYEASPNRLADRSYESVRHAYLLGHLARRNPDYAGKSFAEIEPELQRAWTQDLWSRYGDWAGLRGYVRAAYEGEPGTE
jgi:hypothetical protein